MQEMEIEPVAPDRATATAERVCLVRPEVVSRFRIQVAAGAYEPPVDALVDRLVSLILAEAAEGRPGPEG
jgi:hypothetical protein